VLNVHIEILTLGDNYVYLLVAEGGAAVVDPSSAQEVLSAARKLDVGISTILVTHHHFDHTAGCKALKSATGCEIVGPDHCGIPGLDRRVGDGDRVPVAGTEFLVLAVPGHTLTHVAYHSPEEKILFTGDTLFAGGCGRLCEGAAAQMLTSLNRLRSLPDDTLVYCGHDYTVENLEFAAHLDPDNADVKARRKEVTDLSRNGKPTVPSLLGTEKMTNPFLREGLTVERFSEIRGMKDRW